MTATTSHPAPPGAPAPGDWREQARHLIAQGLSNRAIARHPGMPGKDAIRHLRSRLATAHHLSPAQTPPGAPAAPDNRATTATGARHDAPPAAPPANPGPERLALRLNPDLRDDLAVLTEAGHDPQQAVAYAVQLLADAYRYAWDYDMYARGDRPRVRIRPIPSLPAPATAAHPNGTPQ